MINQLWGVIIGGLLGLGGATLTPWLAARRDRARSRAFVRAYLVSILDIAEARGHVERAKGVLEQWRSGKGDVQISYFGSQSEAVGDPVASGDLLKQAGFLSPEDAADLARFVQRLRAVRIDLDASSTPEFKQAALEIKIARLQWTIDQWLKAKEIAERLIVRL
jgi:hypothetical protein